MTRDEIAQLLGESHGLRPQLRERRRQQHGAAHHGERILAAGHHHRRRIAAHALHRRQQRRDRAMALQRLAQVLFLHIELAQLAIRSGSAGPRSVGSSLAVSTSRALMRSRSAAILSRSDCRSLRALCVASSRLLSALQTLAGLVRAQACPAPRRAAAKPRCRPRQAPADHGLGARATSLPNAPSMRCKPTTRACKSPSIADMRNSQQRIMPIVAWVS